MRIENPDVPPYQPIPCDRYARLELAILRRERLRLSWKDGNVCFALCVTPIDLETRAGEEFLHYLMSTGELACVRLDRILSAEPA